MILAYHAVRTTRLLASSSIAPTRLSALNLQLGPRTAILRKMSTLPKTMKAVQIEKTGGTDVLQYKTDVPVPEPKEGEVLVKNEFIGINYIDT
jgi:NADPH2:quinone reductase